MKKARTIVFLALVAALTAACGGPAKPTEPDPPATYTVTFVQAGFADITRTVTDGVTLTDVPAVQAVVGYSVAWDRNDFTDIRANTTVTAVATPNTYTVTYDAAGGSVSPQTQTVTFDADYALATPTYADGTKSFLYWKYNDDIITNVGSWSIAGDVTLEAAWQDVEPDVYTFTFVHADGTEETRRIVVGEVIAESDIPAPKSLNGYTVVWDKTNAEIMALTGNTTITAVKTANEYKIYYGLGECADDDALDFTGGEYLTVTFGKPYALSKPACDGYVFVGWRIADSAPPAMFENGTYTAADDTRLVAVWQRNISHDRWWTEAY